MGHETWNLGDFDPQFSVRSALGSTSHLLSCLIFHLFSITLDDPIPPHFFSRYVMDDPDLVI